ncbi:MAG: hypothetical protein ACD_4C00456G0001 [uncultured bacterium (gcode 4)]|uniref:Uncharacterized protein n=1 Tax=uncultured bacterium (gcode 4) TaxID=1234023 RepID=K2GRY1_9BACT|nr:MAG: hypothetical protein ACD_4C00456G0001 [uncultured bacterium (gcode 4)]
MKYRFYDKMKIINENSKINYKKALSDLELLPNIDFKMLIQENINIEIVYELEINYLKSKKTLQEVFSESKGLYDKTLEILTFLSWKK